MDHFRPTLHRARRMLLLSALIAALCLLPGVPAQAMEVSPAETTGTVIPSEFGQVILQLNPESDRQVFIVGHSHRSAKTGANGIHTVRSQAEVYRIGEWLIEKENVRLLLPEGFFRRRPEAVPVPAVFGVEGVAKVEKLDSQSLVDKLSDTSIFINADILLKTNYNIRLQQVEDEEVYHAVGRFLHLVDEVDPATLLPGQIEMELDYLQEIRSAAILQNAAGVIEEEFRQGTIDEAKAILTIGMAHVDEIIRFLREGRIDIKAPPFAANHRDLEAILQLVDAGYGVTVILPRSLVDDREALRMANLNNI